MTITPQISEVVGLLTADPRDRISLKRHLAPLPPAQRVEVLVEAQREIGRIVEAAFLLIFELDSSFDAEAALPGFGASHLAAVEMQDVARLWAAVGAGEPIPEDISLRIEDARLYDLLIAKKRVILRAGQLQSQGKALLAAHGIDAVQLDAAIAQLLSPHPDWNAILDVADPTRDVAQRTRERREAFCAYQAQALDAGRLALPDLLTWAQQAPLDSCLLFGRVCYFFGGKVPFFFICTGAGAMACCLWLPGPQICIDLGAGIQKFFNAGLFANTSSLLAKRLLRHRNEYCSALGAPKDRQTRFSVVTHQAANPAHHLWNFFTGLERIVRLGQIDKVEEVFFGGNEFYGPLAELFPEFAPVIVDGVRSTMFGPYPFDPDRTLLTVGGYFIPVSLQARLLRAAGATSKAKYSPQTIRDLTANAFPVMWIGLRQGDKSWKSQEKGLVELCTGILEHYPSALFLLDGFSLPVGRDEISAKWAHVRQALGEVADRICSELPQGRAINLVDTYLSDAVLWAAETDVYLTPVGSSQHKVGWLSSAEGLVYSAPRASKVLDPEKLPGAWEAEGARLPDYVIGRPVEAGVRRNDSDRRAYLDNVELDVSELLEVLLRKVANRKTERTDKGVSTSVSDGC